MLRLIIISLIIWPFFALADVYSWKDENGRMHYSEKPIDGAQALDLKETVNYASTRVPRVVSRSPALRDTSVGMRPIGINDLILHPTLETKGRTPIGEEICERKRSVSTIFSQRTLQTYLRDIRQVFTDANYQVTSNLNERFTLRPALLEIKGYACTTLTSSRRTVRSDVYVKMEWILESKQTGSVLYQTISEGTFNGIDLASQESSVTTSITNAMTAATNNMLSNGEFLRVVNERMLHKVKTVAAPMEINLLDTGPQAGVMHANLNKKLLRLINKDQDDTYCTLLSNEFHVLCPTTEVQVEDTMWLEYMGNSIEAEQLRGNVLVTLFQLKSPIDTAHFPKPFMVSKPNELHNVHVYTAIDEPTGYEATIFGLRQTEGYNFSIIKGLKVPSKAGLPIVNEQGLFLGFKHSDQTFDLAYPLSQALTDLNISYTESITDHSLIETLKQTVSKAHDWLNQPFRSTQLNVNE